MSLREDLQVAWTGLLTNRLRAGLTMLGIIIGVAAVIALVSVGQSAGKVVTEQVESLGSNLVIITPSRGSGVQFTLQDAQELAERVPGLVAVSPIISANVTVAWGGQTHETNLLGVGPAYLQIQDWPVRIGRAFTAAEFALHERVVLLGQGAARQLFGTQRPLGRLVTINGQTFRVIGLLAEKGAIMGQDMDDRVLIPTTTAQRLLVTDRIHQIFAQARSGQEAALIIDHIQRVMELRFHQEDAVNVLSQDQLLAVVNSMTATLTLMLAAIAGISLLVGGIGIMNIMLVSVTERTREIGVRKALGARRRDIRNQFLVEAVLLSVVGGVIGILIGGFGSTLISRALGWTPGVSLASVLLAFGFSVLVGIVFGLWPALNAARLDPVEALRYE